MAKRYYWLKLKADWFSDKRIKKLRSIAGGDTHTIIYLKMMLLSLKDEGKLYFEGVEDNFASEIALALDEDAENVKLTLAFLQRHGLIEIGDDDEYQLTEVLDLCQYFRQKKLKDYAAFLSSSSSFCCGVR